MVISDLLIRINQNIKNGNYKSIVTIFYIPYRLRSISLYFYVSRTQYRLTKGMLSLKDLCYLWITTRRLCKGALPFLLIWIR
jgi:hypothetical protein